MSPMWGILNLFFIYASGPSPTFSHPIREFHALNQVHGPEVSCLVKERSNRGGARFQVEPSPFLQRILNPKPSWNLFFFLFFSYPKWFDSIARFGSGPFEIRIRLELCQIARIQVYHRFGIDFPALRFILWNDSTLTVLPSTVVVSFDYLVGVSFFALRGGVVSVQGLFG